MSVAFVPTYFRAGFFNLVFRENIKGHIEFGIYLPKEKLLKFCAMHKHYSHGFWDKVVFVASSFISYCNTLITMYSNFYFSCLLLLRESFLLSFLLFRFTKFKWKFQHLYLFSITRSILWLTATLILLIRCLGCFVWTTPSNLFKAKDIP